MKKIADCLTVAAFFIIIVMFAAHTLFFGKTDTANETENMNIRQKAETYVDGNFPLNTNWKSLRTTMLVMTGKNEFDDVYILKKRLVDTSCDYDNEKLLDSVGDINKFAAGTSAQVYVMLVPTAAGIYSSQLPVYAQDIDQRELIDQIYYALDKNVSTIDTFYPLYSARSNYIYYRTDKKWTSFGAYYAYADGIKQMGFEPVALSNYDQEYASDSFYGNLYSKLCYSRIPADRVNIFRSKYQSTVESVDLYSGEQKLTAKSVYFRSALKTSDKSNIFLQGDNFTKATVKTTLEDGPKLLLVKGSYANTFVPFLTPHYSEITLVDPDKLEEEGKTLTDVADPNDYDQVLFLYDCDEFSEADNFDLLK